MHWETPMTDDNLVTVRRVYDAFAARDMKRIQEYFAEDVEVHQTPELPWGGSYKGHQGLFSFLLHLIEHVESQVVTERLFAAGNHVVLSGRTQGKVLANGAPFDVPVVHVWDLRAGKVVRYESYIDTPAMLEALRR
jgi:ketosteroid isomerase-like protein